MSKRILALLLAGLACASGSAQSLHGSVTRVVDGDSLWVTPDQGQPVEVRLEGIDAPEICQAGGPEAREALSALVLNRPVDVKGRARDAYGRLIAVVTVDGLNVNQHQVSEGQAWSNRFKWDQGPFVKQERVAKSLRRGLHAAGGAVMPSEFRRSHGPCPRAPASTAAAAAANFTTAATSTAPALATASSFRCDGRTRCTQMRSCDEAKFFLQQCPGVQMDGDHDGIPCELQWCH